MRGTTSRRLRHGKAYHLLLHRLYEGSLDAVAEEDESLAKRVVAVLMQRCPAEDNQAARRASCDGLLCRGRCLLRLPALLRLGDQPGEARSHLCEHRRRVPSWLDEERGEALLKLLEGHAAREALPPDAHLPRGTKGSRMRRASHVPPREVCSGDAHHLEDARALELEQHALLLEAIPATSRQGR